MVTSSTMKPDIFILNKAAARPYWYHVNRYVFKQYEYVLNGRYFYQRGKLPTRKATQQRGYEGSICRGFQKKARASLTNSTPRWPPGTFVLIFITGLC